ncbi:MAG: hypothetical protein QXS54_01410 [Candidatus Methanomethylicaceae archaeon]
MVVDEARGPAGAKAGLIWHFIGGEQVAVGHFRLRGGDDPVEMHLIPMSDGRIEVRGRRGSAVGWKVVYQGRSELRLTAMFSQQ